MTDLVIELARLVLTAFLAAAGLAKPSMRGFAAIAVLGLAVSGSTRSADAAPRLATSAVQAIARADVPAGNLLRNPGAEADAASTDDQTISSPSGWLTSRGSGRSFTAVAYGSPNFPSTSVAAAIGGERNFFAGGPNAASTSAGQFVDLSSAGADIDAGRVTATLSADLGGYASQEDSATITVTFRNAAGTTIGNGSTIGPVTAANRDGQTGLLLRSSTASVPAGARTAYVELLATRASGAFNDGYADNVSLTLKGPAAPSPPPPPPPPTTTGVTADFKVPSGAHWTKEVVLDASRSSHVAQFRWDLNGDGATDVSCDGRQPFLGTQFVSRGDRRVTLTAVGSDQRTATTTRNLDLLGPAVPPHAKRFVHPAAFCQTLSPDDFTPGGGPPAGCNNSQYFGYVRATGCWRRAATPNDVPALERTTIDQLIIEFNSHSQLRDYAATVCTDLAGKNCQELRGKIDRRESDKMLDASGVYISERTVRVNGIDIQPLGNHVVVVSPQLRAIVSASATVRLGDAFLYTGPLYWDVDETKASGGRLFVNRFDKPLNLPRIGGFKLRGALDLWLISKDQASLADLRLVVPPVFGVLNGDQTAPVSICTGALAGRDLCVSDFHLDGAGFLGMNLSDLSFQFDGTKWKVTAKLLLGDDNRGFYLAPVPGQAASNDNGIRFGPNGGFAGAGAHIVFPQPEPELFPGVVLKQIGVGFDLDPTALRGNAILDVLGFIHVDGQLITAFPSADAPYTLPGGFGPSSGQVFRTTLVALQGAASINLPLTDTTVPMADAHFVYAFPGYVAFGGKATFGFKDVLDVTGGLDGVMNVPKGQWSLHGLAEGRLLEHRIGGAEAWINHKGFVICASIAGLDPGVGFHYGDTWPTIFWGYPGDGCKPSWFWVTVDAPKLAYRSQSGARITAAAPTVVHVPAGTHTREIRLISQGGAPKVRITAPNGESLSTGSASTATAHIRFASSESLGVTWIGLVRPPAGAYRIELLPGSPPISKAAVAGPAPTSTLKASVRQDKRGVRIQYALPPVKGQSVRFYEENAGIPRLIGTANAARGTIRFKPSPGSADRRRVIAETALNDVTVARRAIGRFKASLPAAPRATTRIALVRRSDRLAVSWARVEGVTGYVVALRGADGSAKLVRITASSRSTTIAGVSPTIRGVVSVRAIGQLGLAGPSTIATFKASRTVPDHFLPYSTLGKAH